MSGKLIRVERLLNRDSRNTLIIPMDHDVTIGPGKGLVRLGDTVDLVVRGGANAVVGHLGLALHGHRGYGGDVGLILHLSASTCLGPDPNNKVLVNTVENAIKVGADAVSVHCNVGAEDEAAMLADLGAVSAKCMDWGMPLLAMMYARGHDIEDEQDAKVIAHVARIGMAFGADIIKVPYTGSQESFRQVVEACGNALVVIAGGSKGEDEVILRKIWEAMQVGCRGVSIGRGVFGHEYPDRMTAAIAAVVHEGANVQEALGILKTAIEIPG